VRITIYHRIILNVTGRFLIYFYSHSFIIILPIYSDYTNCYYSDTTQLITFVDHYRTFIMVSVKGVTKSNSIHDATYRSNLNRKRTARRLQIIQK